MAVNKSGDDFNVKFSDVGKELHEGLSIKDEELSIKEEIDIDEIPFESQVSEDFDYSLIKCEIESGKF